jgi:hypothetical protein
MDTIKYSLLIDAEKVRSHIEAFIRDNMSKLRRVGIVVPFLSCLTETERIGGAYWG